MQAQIPFTNHPLYPIATRLRPEIAQLEGVPRLQAFSEVLAALYITPLALVSLLWLLLATSGQEILNNALPLALLTFALWIINQQVAGLVVKLDAGRQIRLIGSLDSLVLWAGLLAWGPVMLWAEVLSSLLARAQEGWRRSRFNQDAFWTPLGGFGQDVGSVVPGSLLGLLAYRALGGGLPFNALEPTGWLAPLVAIVIAALLPALTSLPLMLQISSLAGIPITAFSLRSFFFSVTIFGLVPGPFAIPISLLYPYSGLWAFIFALVGLVLVNSLAHYLSRSNDRSQQQSREMTRLEKLGEAILQAPPDGSTLTEILQNQVESMFVSPLDRVEIRLFDPQHLPGLALTAGKLHLVQPAAASPLPDSAWETLRGAESSYQVLKNHIPEGMKAAYGDALLVKILETEGQACLGGIFLLRHVDEARTLDSLPTAQALASQIASAIFRAQAHHEALTAAKMSQELAFAGKIQASFIPERVPSLTGWSLAASLTPARQTSGDFYDFVELPDGKIGLVVADVADKGTGAALYMALSRTLLRTFAMQFPADPAEALRQANERLLADSRADQFVTLFYAVLDPATGSLTYCNAGHNPPLVLRADAPTVPELLSRTGTALGVMEELTWQAKTVQLERGDALILYTDGVTEAQDAANLLFGEERLFTTARAHLAQSASDLHAAILEAIRAFVGEAPQFDDITLVTVKRE